MSFMQGIGVNPHKEVIIDLAKQLSLKLIVEGVETEQQMYFFRGTKCDIARGFLYSRTCSFKDSQVLLKENTFTC
jgi:EAL domain-containing protein (putative c-di-GMP-specific phosphodiesterase class I)